MFQTIPFLARVASLKLLNRAQPSTLARLQQERLRRLLQVAVERSPFYRDRLRGIDVRRCPLRELPILTKPEMMEQFDDIVTDPRITKKRLTGFMAEPGHVGRRFLDRYAVSHTSGSQGQPALIVQEHRDMLLPFALQTARGQRGCRRPGDILRRLLHRPRIALVTQRPGFYASGAMFAYLNAARLPIDLVRLSVFDPIDQLVARLNELRPNFLIGYTSSLEMLAREQEAGRLKLRESDNLEQLTNISEPLPPSVRQRIEASFGVPIADDYAMAECAGLTSGCPFHAGAHLNTDLAILEVVDSQNQPVPDGEPGDKILVTNLYNHVQPIIRYEIGDVVTMNPTPCACGSPFPLIRSVAGRTKERFWVRVDDGYRELPYFLFLAALHHCVDLAEHQVVQVDFNHFLIRVAPQAGRTVSAERVRALVHQSVSAEGLDDVVQYDIEVVPRLLPDPVSGKMHRAVNRVGPPPELVAV